jgi:hypothetical protein
MRNLTQQIYQIFLSDDYVLANVLNDITNYEAHQNSVPVQNLSQNVTNAPTCNLNNFQIPTFQGPPGTVLAISSINNSTVNFYFQSKQFITSTKQRNIFLL